MHQSVFIVTDEALSNESFESKYSTRKYEKHIQRIIKEEERERKRLKPKHIKNNGASKQQDRCVNTPCNKWMKKKP